MTLIEQVQAQKRKLTRAEQRSETKLADERAELRRLMEAALSERYRQADLARAMNISASRVGELLHGSK